MRVPWDQPLALTVADGTLQQVTAVGPDGAPVDGDVSAAGWTSRETLLPGSTYRLTATVLDRDGTTRTVEVSTRHHACRRAP